MDFTHILNKMHFYMCIKMRIYIEIVIKYIEALNIWQFAAKTVSYK